MEPLPKAEWKPAALTPEEQIEKLERDTFIAAITDLTGQSYVNVCTALEGVDSVVTGHKMFTPEALYKHCKALTDNGLPWFPHSEEEQKTKVSEQKKLAAAKREQERSDQAAKRAYVESLNQEWRKRINARKEAMATWDLYVSEAHAAFSAAKRDLL